ncbi:phosphatidylinositol-specific phospholipase C1-like protein [Kribbella ginsengisoli]|uniref:Phosphatidylinositol-specific phospholipase C1-like protein n=1 Tax=Kribbella ginsengisoli TaxID=363865 RepID=A0ABP6Y882_9ACTN
MQVSRRVVAGLASLAVAGGGLAGSAALPGQSADAKGGQRTNTSGVRMNQVQQIGSHNSYHRELNAAEQKAQLSLNPGVVDLFYSHASVPQQLEDQNMRTLEFDLFPDPAGGLYQYPLLRKLTGQGPLTDPALAQPGIKVMHIPDFDYNTNCRTFVLCLQQVKTWTDEHPDAAPISINLELKQSDPQVVAAGGVVAPPWDAGNLDSVDAEIRSVFSADDLITPDDVRKPGLTLEQSVLTKGWPTLREARGKVMFYFDNGGPGSAIRDLYRAGKPNLEGRAVFTRGPEGEPDAAITEVNDPRGAGQAEIQRLVKKGYLVRSRSDEPMATIRTKDYTRLGIALASGAQYVTTDFPVAGMAARYDSDFVAQLPEKTAVRCNPVTAPSKCRGVISEER